MILVVGATGQLGSLVVRELRARDRPVRAMVRDPATVQDLAELGAELVTADLTRAETLPPALTGVTGVVATANPVAPSRPGDTTEALDAGYAELVAQAERADVARFVLASVPPARLDDHVPVVRSKRRIEQALAASGTSWVSLQMPPFIEVWLALVGSELPLRGEERATLARPYATLRQFRRLTGRTVERNGVMVVPGPATTRNAFLSVHDAARAMAAAVEDTSLTGPVRLGGPQVLSWTDVAEVYGRVLGRRVRVVSVPVGAYTVLQRALAGVAPSLSGVMGLDRLIGSSETDWDSSETAARLGLADLRTVEEVLREKAALQPA